MGKKRGRGILKYDYRLVEVAEKLVAAGHTVKDLAYLFSVEPKTITNWKGEYPELRKAIERAKDIKKQVVLAQMFRVATGYEYETVKEEYGASGDLIKKTITTSYAHPDGSMLQFLATNMLPEEWKWRKQLVEQKKDIQPVINVKMDVEKIKRLTARIFGGDTGRDESESSVSPEPLRVTGETPAVEADFCESVSGETADSVQVDTVDV